MCMYNKTLPFKETLPFVVTKAPTAVLLQFCRACTHEHVYVYVIVIAVMLI